MKGIVLLEKGDGRNLLIKKCREIGVRVKVIDQLVEAELEQAGKKRRDGINDRIEEILSGALDESEGN